jgi:hypothetical protein
MFIAFLLPLVFGCAGSDTVEPVNQSPTIEYTSTEIAVDFAQNTPLSVSVSDPDGDPLTLTWEITSGTLQDTGSKTTKTWVPPRSVGTDTLYVRVSDGELSASITEIIKRGRRTTGSEFDNWTFTKASSPWILDPPSETIGFGSPTHGTVTIEPGVELYINKPDLAVEILGTLECVGTQADTILIQPNDRTLRCADQRDWWEGMRVITDETSAGVVNMAYTQMSYGVRDLWLWQGNASATLEHCRFVCSSEAAVEMGSTGSILIDHCDISSNKKYGIAISSGSSVPASVTITNNRIRSNGHTGIYMDLRDISQSLTIVIERNEIKLNAVHGVSLTNAAWASIQHNDFILNNLSNISNIWLDAPYPYGIDVPVDVPADWDSLLATDNYWGRSYDPGDVGLIEDTVEDRSDNPSLGTYVIVDPWQNTPQAE